MSFKGNVQWNLLYPDLYCLQIAQSSYVAGYLLTYTVANLEIFKGGSFLKAETKKKDLRNFKGTFQLNYIRAFSSPLNPSESLISKVAPVILNTMHTSFKGFQWMPLSPLHLPLQ